MEVIAIIVVGLLAVALIALCFFLKGLVDRLIRMVDAMRDKLDMLDSDIKPILKDVERMLSEVEPLAKELGERHADIGAILENISRVTDDAQATTKALRDGLVPIGHSLSGLFAGFIEGRKALAEQFRRGNKFTD